MKNDDVIKCAFGIGLKRQSFYFLFFIFYFLLLRLFLLLFMSLIVLFDTIYEFHFTISATFYLYLQ